MISAKDRMARLIAAIPWIVAQDGAAADEISERFDYPRDQLVKDLTDVVFYVGVPPIHRTHLSMSRSTTTWYGLVMRTGFRDL